MASDNKQQDVDSPVSPGKTQKVDKPAQPDTPAEARPKPSRGEVPPKAEPPRARKGRPAPATPSRDSASKPRIDQSKTPQQSPGSQAAPKPRPGDVGDPAPARQENEVPATADDANEGVAPDVVDDFEVEIEPTGKKGASKRRKATGDTPRHIDPKEIIGRLAEKNDVILDLTRKNKLLENERNALQNKVLRSAAEFDNFRKRSRKEWELLKQQSKADVVLEVLHLVDDFERAFSVVGERDDDFVQGIRLIHNNLVATLEKLGVQRIEARHAPFDPKFHMAVAQIDSKDVKSGHVVEIVQEGYTLDGTVIRPTRVVIAK